jgi:hypothetical protein
MALTWDDVQRVKKVEAMANELGFVFAAGVYGYASESSMIVLKPKDDCLPHYSRNAELFSGSVESIDSWLRGIKWARQYDEVLKLSSDKKRTDKEQAEKNKQLMRTIKTGHKVDGKIGQYTTDLGLDEDIEINEEIQVDEIDYYEAYGN